MMRVLQPHTHVILDTQLVVVWIKYAEQVPGPPVDQNHHVQVITVITKNSELSQLNFGFELTGC